MIFFLKVQQTFPECFSCSNYKGKLKCDARWIKKQQANQVPQCSVDRLIDPLQWKCFCCSAHYVPACNKTKLLLDLLCCILSLKYTHKHTHFPLSSSAYALPETSLHAGRPMCVARRPAVGGPGVQGVCAFVYHACLSWLPILFFLLVVVWFGFFWGGGMFGVLFCVFFIVVLEILLFCQLVAYQYNGKPDWKKVGNWDSFPLL